MKTPKGNAPWPTWHPYAEYIADQCYKRGTFTADKKDIEMAFPGHAKHELESIEQFCEVRNLTLAIDKKKQTFTFTLIEADFD